MINDKEYSTKYKPTATDDHFRRGKGKCNLPKECKKEDYDFKWSNFDEYIKVSKECENQVAEGLKKRCENFKETIKI
jgi:hypothetical protein